MLVEQKTPSNLGIIKVNSATEMEDLDALISDHGLLGDPAQVAENIDNLRQSLKASLAKSKVSGKGTPDNEIDKLFNEWEILDKDLKRLNSPEFQELLGRKKNSLEQASAANPGNEKVQANLEAFQRNSLAFIKFDPNNKGQNKAALNKFLASLSPLTNEQGQTIGGLTDEGWKVLTGTQRKELVLFCCGFERNIPTQIRRDVTLMRNHGIAIQFYRKPLTLGCENAINARRNIVDFDGSTPFTDLKVKDELKTRTFECKIDGQYHRIYFHLSGDNEIEGDLQEGTGKRKVNIETVRKEIERFYDKTVEITGFQDCQGAGKGRQDPISAASKSKALAEQTKSRVEFIHIFDQRSFTSTAPLKMHFTLGRNTFGVECSDARKVIRTLRENGQAVIVADIRDKSMDPPAVGGWTRGLNSAASAT